MADRRSVVATTWAGNPFASMSRRQSCATMSRFDGLISDMANSVSVSSGTARMSRISRRVNPMEPAPIMAILMGMYVVLLAWIVLMQNTGGTVPTDFDKLWDYNTPAATETKFVELLPTAEKAGDSAY